MTFTCYEHHIAGTRPGHSFLDRSGAIMLNPDIGMINYCGADSGDNHTGIFAAAAVRTGPTSATLSRGAITMPWTGRPMNVLTRLT